jgi:hypothetical protein
MAEHIDLRRFPTAYEAREHLPSLSEWMSDDDLKLLPIWKGTRLEAGQTFFDLDNPERGPFVATDDTGPTTDHTYVCRRDVPEDVWIKLITWRQPISPDQAEALSASLEHSDILADEGGPAGGGPYAAG